MYRRTQHRINVLIMSALMLLPTTTVRPVDKSALIATGALVGTLLGAGISYYLNEKAQSSVLEKPTTGRLNKLRQFLNTHPTVRTLLIITFGASTGALATYGILRLLPAPKPKDNDNNPDPDDDYIPRPRDESPEDRTWWQNLTNQATKNEAELHERNQEWSIALEQHFQGKADKIKIYKGILKQLIASEKRKFTNPNQKYTEKQKK